MSESEADYSYSLGYIAPATEQSNATLKAGREISRDSFDKLASWIAPLDRIQNRNNYFILERNYRQLMDLCDVIAQRGRFWGVGPNVHQETLILLLSSLSNYLHSTRMFIDSTRDNECYIFGRDSKEVIESDALLVAAFDGTFGYRFTYHLRNAFQHTIGPPLSITLRSVENEPSFSLTGNPAALLAAFNWKAKVSADLREHPGPVDILAAVTEGHSVFAALDLLVIAHLMRKVAPNLDALEAAVKRCEAPDGATPSAVAFSLSSGGDPTSWKFLPLPTIDTIERLRRASASDDPIKLMVESNPPQPGGAGMSSTEAQRAAAMRALDIASARVLDDTRAATERIEAYCSSQDEARLLAYGLSNLCQTLLAEIAILTGREVATQVGDHIRDLEGSADDHPMA